MNLPDLSPSYRAILFDETGRWVAILLLAVLDDEQAKAEARTMMSRHAVDLWDGPRFIERFEQIVRLH